MSDDLFLQGRLSDTYFDRDHTFQPALLSLDLRKKFHIVTLEDNSEIYVYSEYGGCYEPNGAKKLREIIKKVLDFEYLEHYATATINDITACTYIRRDKFCFPTYLIPVKNGLIDLSSNPWKLQPHNPRYYITNVLPNEYNPVAKAPKFKKYLEEVLPSEVERTRLQEHVGYILYPRNIFEVAVLLTGPPDTGKSTFIKILQALLGERNVTNITLQDLEMDRFALANLDEKLACMYADLPKITLRTSGFIKSIVSGDRQNAQHKHKPRFDFVPRVKLWFSANEPPLTYDTTDAFFKRWDIFEFKNQYPLGDPKRDNFLIDELTTFEELSGILNWALEGRQRLLSNRSFSGMKSIEERREIWLLGASSLYRFVKKCTEEKTNATIIKEDFQGEYADYCARNKLPVLSVKSVGSLLPNLVPSVRTCRVKVGDRQVYAWKGIEIVGFDS